MSDTGLVAPSGPPLVERWFHYTNVTANNNKFWRVKFWESGCIMETHYGREGGKGSKQYKALKNRNEFEGKILKQLREGYVEIALKQVKVQVAQASPCEPAIERIVRDLLVTAGIAIKEFLNTTLDAMSIEQVRRGRVILEQIEKAHGQGASERILLDLIQKFYNTIPTKLPARIDAQALLREYVGDLAAQSDRLSQLEAAVEAAHPVTNGIVKYNEFDHLASQLQLLSPSSPEWKHIEADIRRGCVHQYNVRVKDIYQVHIPAERARFNANSFGKEKVLQLYHGTRPANLAHIVKGMGLAIRQSVNGSAFGRGLYFASEASKSMNYDNGYRSANGDHLVLVCDVAVGAQFIPPYAQKYTEAPRGYASVWGKSGQTAYLKHHEYIVYRPEQVTIKYLVVYKR